jgi:hypothetical protein
MNVSRRIISWALLATSTPFVSAAAEPSPADVVVASVRDRLRALSQGDKAAWSRLTAEDALLINDVGGLKGKAAVEASFPPARQDVLTDMQDVAVRDCGGVAVVTYVVREVETYPTGSLDSKVRRTEVWVLREGRWQALSVQSTIVPTMRWNAVTVDGKLLDEYVGQYELYPGKVDTVTREGGRLFSRLTGDAEKDELFAVNDTTFFSRGDSAFGIFVRGPDGRVTHYVYRRWDGQSLSARKIK